MNRALQNKGPSSVEQKIVNDAISIRSKPQNNMIDTADKVLFRLTGTRNHFRSTVL
jgi:hypothetical protein